MIYDVTSYIARTKQIDLYIVDIVDLDDNTLPWDKENTIVYWKCKKGKLNIGIIGKEIDESLQRFVIRVIRDTNIDDLINSKDGMRRNLGIELTAGMF